MATYRITAPDGGTYEVTAPDTASQDEVMSYAQQNYKGQTNTASTEDHGTLANIGLGALKGATNIGNTLLSPVRRPLNAALEAVGLQPTSEESLSQFYADNANPDSIAFKGAEIGSSIAGTAGVGGLVAKGVGLIPSLAKYAPAIASGGFNLGPAASTAASTTKKLLQNAATRVAGGATTGAATAGLINPSDAGYGALIGGALPPAVKMAGGLGSSIYQNIKTPIQMMTDGGQASIVGKAALRVAGDASDDVIARLQSAKGLVPGELPTVAEVGESGGLAALQRAMAAADPESYTHRFIANSDARERALRGIAGDETMRAAALKARDSTAKALYGGAYSDDAVRMANEAAQQKAAEAAAKARQAGIDWNNLDVGAAVIPPKAMPTQGLMALADRPAFKDAMSEAALSLKNSGENIPLNSLEGLHRVKLSIDAALNGGSQGSALARYDRRSLMNMKKQLLTEMEGLSPKYGDARQAFSSMSKPINQMDIGQYLLDKLKPASTEYGKLTGERAGSFFQAIRNADQTTKQALGTKAAGGLTDVLSPAQMETVRNVAKSLGRVGNATDLGRGPGSNTFQNLAMDKVANEAGIPSAIDLLGSKIPFLAKIVDSMGNKSEQQMRLKLSQLLLDPQSTAMAMSAARDEAQRAALRSGRLSDLVGYGSRAVVPIQATP